MKSLAELQNSFQDFLLNASSEIYQHIISTEKVPADVRLSIYANAYRVRLIEALADTYSATHAYLGDDAFTEMAGEYINARPSLFRSIRWYGDELAAFLLTHEHYCQYPYLSELVTLEWTMALVFDAANDDVINVERMRAIAPDAWPTLRFRLHPSVYLLDFKWNVVELWQAMMNDQAPHEPVAVAMPTHWLLWRQQLSTKYHALTPDEAYAITAVLERKTFGEICAGLCAWCNEEEVGVRAAGFLQAWIAAGLIADVIE